MSPRPGGPLVRTVIAVALGIGVLAAQAVQPISAANAQTLASEHPLTAPPTHRPTHLGDPTLPKTKPPRWSAASAKPITRPHKTLNAAALRAQAIAHAAATNKTASYRVSPAMVTFLTKGLGLRLGSATLFTGVRSGATIKVSLPAPQGLRPGHGLQSGLPAGVRQPAFSRSTLVIDPATGAATLTATASGAALNITVPDAASATLAGLAGRLTLRVPVLGETVTLSGPLSYRPGTAASASLSGRLPTDADLGRGVAELAAGTAVTLSPAAGLRVAGTASLGPADHQIQADVSGTITGADGWTLTVTGIRGGTPLPGLALSPGASGTITRARGTVSFDVRASTARPWTAANGVTVAGTVDFSNKLPNGRLVPAPGIAGSTPWIDVTGTVTASGVTTHGTAAVNLTSGKGLLSSSGKTPVTLKSRSGRLIHDDAGFRASLGVTRAGRVAASLPTDLSTWTPRNVAAGKATGGSTARSVLKKTASAAADASDSYTLSGPVYNFITSSLNIPLGSPTLTGTLSGSTLTLSASAPTALPASLPSWIPNPSYASTQITVDESTDTVTLSASASTSGGQTATLTVTIANASTSDLSDGTDVTGSLDLTDLPFAGGSTGLQITLGYTGGALSASTTISDASFDNGLVTIPSATLTLASGSGATLTGTANINYGSSAATVAITGTITDLSDWSLQVSDANAQVWQPTTGLTVTPDFSGSIADAAGQVSFDLASADSGPVATWISPDGASSVSVTSLEVSNQAPGSGASCSPSQVNEGDLWIGIGGSFSYSPASLTVNATGCLDLTGKSVDITTSAAGNLTGEFGSDLPFSVNAAGLTASVTSGGQYSLTGKATVQITQGVSGDPSFNVGMSLSSSGIVAGLTITDLSSLGFSGSGALYVSTEALNGFDPADTLGLTGQPTSLDLPAGLSVSVDYTLPSSVTSAFQKVIPGFPAGSAVQTMASLSTSGFTVDIGLSLGAGTGGLAVFDSNGSAFFLNGFDVKLLVGSQNQVTLSGTGTLELPPMAPGEGTSTVGVEVSGSFNFNSLTLSLAFNVADWNNALGVNGLNMEDFGGSLGVTFESGVPTPSLGIYADNVVLPALWADTIGMVPGTEISFNGNFSLTQPAIGFQLVNPNGPVLTPLAIDPDLSSSVVNSFVVDQASFELAPDGGVTPAGDTLQQGVSLIFDATIDSVPMHVNAAVNLSSPSVTANVSVGAFTVGPVQVSNTAFYLNLSPTNAAFGITGGISYNGDSFSANVQFYVGTSMNGASISLAVTGGLPSYFAGGATLSGSVSGDGSGAYVYASGSGWLQAGGQYLGPVSFSFSMPGSLNWSDFSNSITQLAQFFISNAGISFDQAVQALEQFGYQEYDIINAMSEIGQYGPQISNALANAFGFSTTYFDIWTYTSAGEYLVLDVDGGSQSPNAQVITWDWNNGYNQDWAFVQSPYSGWYEIINRGSGQCLTVENNTSTPGNPLIQYPCAGAYNQLWYMGNISLATTYEIESALDGEFVDVQNAYPWPGGTLDQWYYNGGWNQQFWLTNSAN
jgi:hypothetical protein